MCIFYDIVLARNISLIFEKTDECVQVSDAQAQARAGDTVRHFQQILISIPEVNRRLTEY